MHVKVYYCSNRGTYWLKLGRVFLKGGTGPGGKLEWRSYCTAQVEADRMNAAS